MMRTNRRRLERSLLTLRGVKKARLDYYAALRTAELDLREHDGDARRRVDPRQLLRRKGNET